MVGVIEKKLFRRAAPRRGSCAGPTAIEHRPRGNCTAGRTDVARGPRSAGLGERFEQTGILIPQRAELPRGVLGDADRVATALLEGAGMHGRALAAASLPDAKTQVPANQHIGDAVGLADSDEPTLERVVEGCGSVANPPFTGGTEGDLGERGRGGTGFCLTRSEPASGGSKNRIRYQFLPYYSR